MERVDSYRPILVCFYDITFQIGVQLAPSQLMLNGWQYLLGLVILSMQYDLHIDLLILLNFFYLKPYEEGKFTF